MNRKGLIWVGVILAIAAAVAYSYAGKAQTVETVKVGTGNISIRVNETGYVGSVSNYEIQSAQSGYIRAVQVESGQRVKPGQVLMLLDNPDLQIASTNAQTQLAQAEAQLSVAGQALSGYKIDAETKARDLKRKEQLYQAGAATQTEVEEAHSQLLSLQEKINHQQNYINDLSQQVDFNKKAVGQLVQKSSKLTITSPVAGTILNLPLKSGSYVNTGTLVAQIGTPEKLEVEADILSDQMRDIAIGQKVFISASVLGDEVLTGKIRLIRPRAFAKVSALGVEQRRVPVFIALTSTGNLKPEYEVQVSIETALKKGILTLPREAVRTANEQDQVLKVVNGRVKHQIIKIGLRNQDQAEILSGLQAGDVVIRDASEDIADNTKVKGK